MTVRRQTLAAALGLALVGAGAPAAAAAPSDSAAERPVLTWEAEAGEETHVDGSLFGTITVVPWQRETRTLRINNEGSVPGDLQVSIVNSVLHNEPVDEFVDELTINTHTAASLIAQDAVIHSGVLPAGGSVAVPVEIMLAGGSGNAAVVGEQAFSFDLHMELRSELPSDDETPSRDDETPSRDDETPSRDDDRDVAAPVTVRTPPQRPGSPGFVADTGGVFAERGWELLAGALALAVGGLLALGPALRRRKAPDGS